VVTMARSVVAVAGSMMSTGKSRASRWNIGGKTAWKSGRCLKVNHRGCLGGGGSRGPAACRKQGEEKNLGPAHCCG
jgi:hypothetical protein